MAAASMMATTGTMIRDKPSLRGNVISKLSTTILVMLVSSYDADAENLLIILPKETGSSSTAISLPFPAKELPN